MTTKTQSTQPNKSSGVKRVRAKESATRSQQNEKIEIKHGEAKGIYLVHTVASLFPHLTGELYAELKKSIEESGHQEPIVVHDGMVLDGRNRINILNELGQAPKIIQFADLKTGLEAGEWIAIRNLQRRHLTDDQRLAIATKYQTWLREELARQSATPKAQPAHADGDDERGAETSATQSQPSENQDGSEYPPKAAEKTAKKKRGRPRGNRSDAEAVAGKTKQSRYRADQMLKLQEQSPTLAKAVKEGQLSLKEAMRQLGEQQQPKKSRTKRAAKQDAVTKTVQMAEAWLRKKSMKLSHAQRVVFWKQIAELAVGVAKAENEKREDAPIDEAQPA
jgi:hypothetical protein